MISVIIPTYQHADALKQCLDSIARQTFADFEVIVVDDGSTDSTEEVVRCHPEWSEASLRLASRRLGSRTVKYIKQKNAGAPVARNRGFAESQGEYVIFCDADVKMREDCLEKMHEALTTPVIPDSIRDPESLDSGFRRNDIHAFAYSSFRFGRKKFRGFPFDPKRLKKENYIHSTSLIRREAVVHWDESLKKLQDWDFFLRIVENGGRGVWIPDELFKVQVDTGFRISGKAGSGYAGKSGMTRRRGMSEWAPRIAYTKFGRMLGLWRRAIETYDRAHEIIAKKHNL